MALQLNYSIIEHKKSALLDPTYVGVLERGMVLVDAGFTAAGERIVAPSAAAGGERPVGILMLSETNQAQVPLKEDLAVPAAAPLETSLRESPDAVANIRAYNSGTGATIVVVAGAPGAGQLGLTAGNLLTADAALTGVNFSIVYEHNITAAELQRRGGRRSVNGGAEGLYGQVTMGYGNCTFHVSNFDPASLWDVDANVAVNTGAGGDATFGGAGTTFGTLVQEPIMRQTPGIVQAFIGFECNLPG